jgi:hypothetical protein
VRVAILCSALTAAALLSATAAAQACDFPDPPTDALIRATPVVVRGEVTAFQRTTEGDAVLTLAVAETLRGAEAATWTVTWAGWNVIGPPSDMDGFIEVYGHDVVLGLVPAGPGSGQLAQENCYRPFLDSYTEIARLLAETGLL